MSFYYVETTKGETILVAASGVVGGSASKPEETQEMVAKELINLSEVNQCRKWFSQAKKSNPPKVSSFWLQQFLQHWSGLKVSQGAVIVAAWECGFVVDQDPDSRTASASIGVAMESINEFDCGCGHP